MSSESFISPAELAERHGASVWIAVRGKVYDVTNFLDHHPGGAAVIKANAGKDCTATFELVGHSKKAIDYMNDFKIGTLAAAPVPAAPLSPSPSSSSSSSSISISTAVTAAGGSGAAPAAPAAVVLPNGITMEELSKHDRAAAEKWVAIRGKVYNVTEFLKTHPGGPEAILKHAGSDCTYEFDRAVAHKLANAAGGLEKLIVGNMDTAVQLDEATQGKMEGYVVMHSACLHSFVPGVFEWNRWYCVLEGNIVKYYRDYNKKEEKGRFNIFAGSDVAHNNYAGHGDCLEINVLLAKNPSKSSSSSIGSTSPRERYDSTPGKVIFKIPDTTIKALWETAFSASIRDNNNNIDDDSFVAFSQEEFRPFPIVQIDILSHNTKAYKIALPSLNHTMGAVTASYVSIRNADGVIRPYTPTTLNSDKGFMEVVIKKYPNGKVSGYLDTLKVGDKVEVRGAFKKLEYKTNMKKSIGFVAGGTGITPMLQVIQESLHRQDDQTQLSLIFANISETDILLKRKLDEFASKYSRFKVIYVLSRPEDKDAWEATGGFSGHVSVDILGKHLPVPSTDSMVLVCGPPDFMTAVSGSLAPDFSQGLVNGILLTLGYTADMVFKF